MKSIRMSSNFLAMLFLVTTLGLLGYFKEHIEHTLSIPNYFMPSLLALCTLCALFFIIRNNRENEIIKNEFMTIVAHKFRTPLTAIRWSTEILKSDVTYEEKQILLKRLVQASARLSEIVDLLVDFLKYDKGLEYAYKATSLRDMVFESLKRFAEITQEKNIKLSIDPMTSLPLIVIDEPKIQFVIDTVIDNALKYTPKNGTISIGAKLTKSDVVITITDSGIGISTHDMRRIFSRFFRSEHAKKMDTEGLGLGLHTARKIIKDHGGNLKLKSAGENKGTSVVIEIPKN